MPTAQADAKIKICNGCTIDYPRTFEKLASLLKWKADNARCSEVHICDRYQNLEDHSSRKSVFLCITERFRKHKQWRLTHAASFCSGYSNQNVPLWYIRGHVWTLFREVDNFLYVHERLSKQCPIIFLVCTPSSKVCLLKDREGIQQSRRCWKRIRLLTLITPNFSIAVRLIWGRESTTTCEGWTQKNEKAAWRQTETLRKKKKLSSSFRSMLNHLSSPAESKVDFVQARRKKYKTLGRGQKPGLPGSQEKAPTSFRLPDIPIYK